MSKKKLKVDSGFSSFDFSFPVDIFQNFKSGSSFDKL